MSATTTLTPPPFIVALQAAISEVIKVYDQFRAAEVANAKLHAVNLVLEGELTVARKLIAELQAQAKTNGGSES